MRRADRRAFHFIYKTVFILTGQFYMGMHSTDRMDDGYLGSGIWLKRAVKKHGEAQFRREIVEMCDSRKVLRVRETEIVNSDLLNDPMCMNLVCGGWDGPGMEGKPSPLRGRKLSPEHIAAVKAALNTPEVKAKMAAKKGVPRPDVSARMKGVKRGTWGRSASGAPLSDEHKEKIRQSLLGRRKEE